MRCKPTPCAYEMQASFIIHMYIVCTQMHLHNAQPKHHSMHRGAPTLTWHAIVEPFRSARVGLEELTVDGPVKVGDKTGATRTGANVLVVLGNRVDVDKVVV